MLYRSLLSLASAVAATFLAGCCCCDTEAWKTGHTDIVGGTPVEVPSPMPPMGEVHRYDRAAMMPAQPMQARQAVAMVIPTEGNNVRGTVRFEDTPQGLHVLADLQKLPPNATLGFHIHEFGDVSSPDGMSAGGHYNPQGHPHGGPGATQHHAGDLGNIQSDSQGNARLDVTVPDLSLTAENPVLGRTVVVHAQADDLTSQPAGNAGSRIGVGVIGFVKP